MSTNIDDTPANQACGQTSSGETDQLAISAKIAGLRRETSILHRAKNAVPTLLVMGLLAAVGYFGHHYGWKVPKFSELTGQQGESGVLWCDGQSLR